MEYETFRTLVTKDERKRVKALARSRGMTLSGYLTWVIRSELAREEQRTRPSEA